MALCKRAVAQVGQKFGGFNALNGFKYNGNRAFAVDTLAMARSLEAQDFSPKQAQAITSEVTKLLNDGLENVVSKAQMEKIEMLQDSNMSKFKSELKMLQENYFSMLQREHEKLRNDIERNTEKLQCDAEKARREMGHAIDKVTAGQRLDLNIERARISEELANQNAETTNLNIKLDRETNALRTQLEAAKYDVIKYCIASLVSISTVGLTVFRFMI